MPQNIRIHVNKLSFKHTFEEYFKVYDTMEDAPLDETKILYVPVTKVLAKNHLLDCEAFKKFEKKIQLIYFCKQHNIRSFQTNIGYDFFLQSFL